MKKILSICFIFTFIFMLVGCDNQELNSYKETAINNLKQIVNDDIKNPYVIRSELNKISIQINKSTTKEEIDSIVTNETMNINKIKTGEIDLEFILKQFDLTEEKTIWSGTVDDEFLDDSVIVILKKTSTYPELNLKHFNIETATNIEYLSDIYPPEYFFEEGNEDLLNSFRQIIKITISPEGKEKVIEIVRELEKLEFIKNVGPNIITHGGV